jgi:hypothetical protein
MLSDLPNSKWGESSDQVIALTDFSKIEGAILESFELLETPKLSWVDTATVRVEATADSLARLMICGFPNILHPKTIITGGLTDGKYRFNNANVSMNFAIGSTFWGTEKSSQWYLIYALADDEDTDFTLKAMPHMRVQSQADQVISLGTLVTPAAGIGYGFTTDELVGAKIYMLTGTSTGLLRAITANNNNDTDGGTITYGGAALTLAQGDWFAVLPNTNFRLVGEILNNAAGDIAQFIDLGPIIQWVDGQDLSDPGTLPVEDIRICSPLAREARVTLNDPDNMTMIGHASLSTPVSYNNGYSTGSFGTGIYNTVDFCLEFCRYRGSATSLWRVAYRKPY